MTTPTYFETAHFVRLAKEIAALKPGLFFDAVTPDQIMMTLVENDLLPENIRADVKRAARIDAEIEASKSSAAISGPVADEQLGPVLEPAKTVLLN
jgi:hypothetical protein